MPPKSKPTTTHNAPEKPTAAAKDAAEKHSELKPAAKAIASAASAVSSAANAAKSAAAAASAAVSAVAAPAKKDESHKAEKK